MFLNALLATIFKLSPAAAPARFGSFDATLIGALIVILPPVMTELFEAAEAPPALNNLLAPPTAPLITPPSVPNLLAIQSKAAAMAQ